MVRDLNQRYGYIYQLPADRGIIKRLAAYKNYQSVVQALTPLAVAKLVMYVLISLGETLADKEERDPQSNLIRKAQQLIIENLGRPIGNNALAEELNVSREHLSRVFKNQTGSSPIE